MKGYKIIYNDGTREIVRSMDKVLSYLGEIREVEVSNFPASKIVDYVISIGGLRNGER